MASSSARNSASLRMAWLNWPLKQIGAVSPTLTLTEFRLLVHMARHPLRVFARSELVDACMPGSDALDRTVDSHVSNLRRKLGQAGAEDLLVNVRGVGYRLGVPQ